MKRPYRIACLLALTAVLFSACTDPIPARVYAEGECDESMPLFWKKFRDAVLREDMNALADMTRFPLKVEESNNEYVNFTRADFIRRFPMIMNAKLGEPYHSRPFEPGSATRSMKEYVRSHEKTNELLCGPNEKILYFANWTFVLGTKECKGWCLVRVQD